MKYFTLLMGLVALAALAGCRDSGSPTRDARVTEDTGPPCGNGHLDPGEACDQAELNSDAPNAVCRTDCQMARCGDAIVDDARGEQCDLAQANSDAPDAVCRANCRLPRCGDAVVDPGSGEVCDDGNTMHGDGCSADCSSDETCGNGIVDRNVGESCEDGNLDDQDGCLQCVATEIRVNTMLPGKQGRPSVTMLDDGISYVVWRHVEDTGSGWTARIAMQRFTPNGSRDGTEIEIAAATSSYIGSAHVTGVGNDQLVVTWREGDRVVARRVDAATNTPAALLEIAPAMYSWSSTAKVALAPSGAFAVAYEDETPPEPDSVLFLRLFDPWDSPLGDATVVSSEYALSDFDLEMADDGQILIAWSQRESGQPVYQLSARRYDAAGAPVGPHFSLSSSPTGDCFQPRVAMAADGRFTAVWTHRHVNQLQNEVVGRRFAADTTPLGPEFSVNTFSLFDQGSASIDQADDGRFAVAWVSYAQLSDDWDIFTRVFDAQGVPLGPEMAVNHFSDGQQYWPDVAISPGGEILVAWQTRFAEINEGDVYARRYDAQGEPLPLGP